MSFNNKSTSIGLWGGKWSMPAPCWPNDVIPIMSHGINFVGILCGTIAGKKKKKMMYLTAKNAGQNTLHV